MEALAEELFARVPPFRPAPAPEHARAALDAIEAAERPVIVAGGGVRASGAGAGAGGACRAPRRPGRDLAQRQGHHYRRSPALGRRRRNLLARERQPGRGRGRSGLLRRLRDRRHDHALLAGAAHRHPRRADRHRAAVARPQLPAQGGGECRREAGPSRGCWTMPMPARPGAAANGSPACAGSSAIGARATAACWNPTPCPSRPERICHELTRHLPEDAIVMADTGHSGMWMGGMYDLRSPAQSYIRSAGHLGWAFPAGLGAKCAAPERPVFVFTGRRRLLVPPQRDRDGGALRHRHGHAGEQQQLGQPGGAGLRPRLRRPPVGEGTRALDLQRRRLRRRRRGHGGRWACASRSPPTSPARWRPPSPPAGRQ